MSLDTSTPPRIFPPHRLDQGAARGVKCASPERQLCDVGIDIGYLRFGSAAPVRDFRMQSFSRDLVPVVGCSARMTAVAGLCFHEEAAGTGDS